MKNSLIKEIEQAGDPKHAAYHQKYFKTGEGEYGAGDIFIGIKVPVQRKIAHKYKDIALSELVELIQSPIHEYRFVCLEILVFKYAEASKSENKKNKKLIFDFYIKHRKYINNWDLVDTSARYIVGPYLEFKDKDILYKLAESKSIWDRRIAIIATHDYIYKLKYDETLKISEMLMKDSHDLIHKAVGWMLREVGNKSPKTEREFLHKHYKNMPRTMLRYAIEKFPQEERKMYLAR